MDRLFKANLAIIVIVSLIDIYFSIKFSDTLYQDEKNPLGRWLIWVDNGDVAIFMVCKIIGTTLALYILSQLYQYRRVWAEICAASVALAQLMLLGFLLS